MSALSLAYPIQNLLIAFAVGTAAGVTSLISRRLGQGRRAEAESTATHGVRLSIITWLAFAAYSLVMSVMRQLVVLAPVAWVLAKADHTPASSYKWRRGTIADVQCKPRKYSVSLCHPPLRNWLIYPAILSYHGTVPELLLLDIYS